jgi:hypothetical protein
VQSRVKENDMLKFTSAQELCISTPGLIKVYQPKMNMELNITVDALCQNIMARKISANIIIPNLEKRARADITC